ncbi:YceH family protein [Aromatoleum aromaticum]|uniref:UPF0502 protein AZOSEA09860 n=1 Tax=Aromatoleum aromaticum (strain DSM 19018 / LMG 30748 / EbN1) TaxID=76114 RepID=Y986_AROAE|nr:YceH family protein [Aromatoleum aromaticum]Q5P6F0.1 RecName: Full=UPF0502 protein AZOSEA09860 [Aromatoleum aromaticum EbN1]NMG56140.1 DUF480 domain-containing protein [Aromatoleum aromaticum]CAI07111.1 conserved hypothetical protein [Aromatoleum aromaticum EbN1]
MTDHTLADADEGFDLDSVEIRVLGVLMEKAFVTPDNYPLSVNAIVTGSNQLTGRDPVMNLTETEVQEALDRLIARKLVSKRDQASARVGKYEHLVRLRHSLPPPEQAALATLMLRGAQTAGEIRQRSERMHRFDDIAAVDKVLEHLGEKYPPMVAAVPKAPGTKETRYAHLLGGRQAFVQMGEAVASGYGSGGAVRGRTSELEEEVRRLRDEFDVLRSEFEKFRSQFE